MFKLLEEQMPNQQVPPGADPENTQKLEGLLGQNYEQFVTLLQKNITDPKFLAFLEAGKNDGKMLSDDQVNFSQITPTCTDLTPTQSEIDIDKSLSYPLMKASTADLLAYFKGGTFAPGGPIVTCGGGKYIIDGHHRWSQLFCMNPQAKIKAIDMTDFTDPVLALKVVQLSIAATTKQIPSQTVQGQNLIGMAEATLKEWVASKISEQAKQAFAQISQGQDPVAYAQAYIWKNVSRLNPPISQASNRGFMPETDPEGNFAANLQAGDVNWSQSENKLNKGITLNEWLVLSGLKR